MKQSILVLTMVAVFSCFSNLKTMSQEPANSRYNPASFPEKLYKDVESRSVAINKKLALQSEKYLKRMLKEERRLQKKLSRIDSVAGRRIFRDAEMQYFALLESNRNPLSNPMKLPQKYLPRLDSLGMAVQFLQQGKANPGTGLTPGLILNNAANSIDLLKNRFSQVDYIEKFLEQRKRLLQQQLGNYGLTRQLRNLQKNVYYYKAEAKEYQNLLNHPSMAEAKALAVLRQNKMFRNFFRQHSELAGLFSLPETVPANPISSFTTYQTRDMVEQQLMQRFGYVPGVNQVSLEQPNKGLLPVDRLKEQLHKTLPGTTQENMPDFTPNSQKTKSFLHRFELGTNFQTVKSNNFFPSTTDLGLSLGYKVNDKSVVGIGSSYKMGWGKSIRQISITHQGIGFRSFADIKIRESIWLSGGAEMNYRSRFDNFEILNDYSPWQKSALLGLSKKYRVSNKLKGNMQLLYDFLNRQQVPRTSSLVFRVGYTW